MFEKLVVHCTTAGKDNSSGPSVYFKSVHVYHNTSYTEVEIEGNE